jgi:DNA-binding MarR family transcriptional regulator
LTSAGLSISQFSLLATLLDQPGISITQFSDFMVMERTTLMRALKPLQASGLVRSSAEGVRAALRFFLTASGVAKVKEAESLWIAAQAEIENYMSCEKAASVRASLLPLGQTV